jgi:class 3 adenylate cyclase
LTDSGASHFRGHLFADLRGSTAFTEKAGNAAGAELVGRFRQLVRDEVSQHDGAEVKTEGDAIYVVFPSASTAVMCGLAIVERAAHANETNPQAPIRVGVGVHAGEAVAVPEGGYIGTAVNLASRVCGVAEAGEVLVTGTVRSIAQQSIPVTFVSRGKRRLKGIAEPVELYRVVPEGVTVPTAWSVRARRLAADASVVVALLVVVLLAFALLTKPRPSAVAQATATPVPPTASPALPTAAPVITPQAPRIGSLGIGEYATSEFQPRLGFTIADPGWSMTTETSSKASFLYEPSPGGKLEVGRINTIYSNPCLSGGDDLPTVNSSQEIFDALKALSFVHIGEPTPIFVSGWGGQAFDVNIDASVLAACDPGAGGVAVFPLGGKDFVVQTGQLFKVVALDKDGTNVSFVSTSNAGPDESVAQIQTFFDLAQRVIDSVNF